MFHGPPLFGCTYDARSRHGEQSARFITLATLVQRSLPANSTTPGLSVLLLTTSPTSTRQSPLARSNLNLCEESLERLLHAVHIAYENETRCCARGPWRWELWNQVIDKLGNGKHLAL